jgi:ATP-dependent DNA helicase RecG
MTEVEPNNLNEQSVLTLHGVGAKFAEQLAKLGIVSVQDLLFHLPLRYVDRTRIKPIASLALNETALVDARVVSSHIRIGKRRSLQVQVEDDSGELKLRFFHFSAAQKNALSPGRELRIFGELRPGPGGMEMYHPEYEYLDADAPAEPPPDTLTAIYPSSEGISQQRLRKLAAAAIETLNKASLEELLPDEINARFAVASLADALRFLHFPPSDCDQAMLSDGMHPAQQRLAFEELLAHFLTHRQIRIESDRQQAPEINAGQDDVSPLLSRLPFSPTGAQQRVFSEIQTDLAKGQPMLRLVQGDVGSGKTLVAAMAALVTIQQGHQVALVAPTEILAEQHLSTLSAWLTELGLRCELLVGKMTAKQKRLCLEKLRDREIDLIVGTHALFQDNVQFARLGLVIIDEQHRFGVHQRLTLREKSLDGLVPHQLVMTATPIPRTLAMTSFSEMDVSIIDELPPGRQVIQTSMVSQNRRDQLIERIAENCREGKQIYWVCPLIEESESLSAANAESVYEELLATLPEVNITLVHGRLNAQDKSERMQAFKSGDTQLLVATTVIEVGVDVPNASIMVIENPERLGLAQLHQLRGRVGRGAIESHCILLYGDPLTRAGRERLSILRETSDGFKIAEKDLEMRGPGEFLGTRQAGDLLFRVADHERDAWMLDCIHRLGLNLIIQKPELVLKLIERWFAHKKIFGLG